MSNASLLSLPVELLHRIFDDIDTITLLRSVRYVCKSFYAFLNAYYRFKLDLSSTSRSNIRVICILIRPEQIISLTLSDNATSTSIRLFLSLVDICRFTRLRFLTLRQIESVNADRFFDLTFNRVS
jgi:hypothetical protein